MGLAMLIIHGALETDFLTETLTLQTSSQEKYVKCVEKNSELLTMKALQLGIFRFAASVYVA
tara:strand:+ start:167 stop:352 length:186 start_codon:yes stop_codon:yes gene_type:complete